MAERALLSPLVEKNRFALLQYASFLKDVLSFKEIDAQIGRDLDKRSQALSKKIAESSVNESELTEELQGLIDGLNARLLSQSRQHLFPLFPQEAPINQVQNHIIAFELYLNYRLLFGEITLEEQAPLFHKAMVLWRDVGVRRTLKEAMVELASLIGQAQNAIKETPDNKGFKYPLPNPDLY